jgi:hypothetical protein
LLDAHNLAYNIRCYDMNRYIRVADAENSHSRPATILVT